MPGATTSTAAVTNISQHGFWMLVDRCELFLAFDQFPWFKHAAVDAILRLERPSRVRRCGYLAVDPSEQGTAIPVGADGLRRQEAVARQSV